MGYVPPRGPDGKILIETALLLDEPPAPAPAPILQTAPVGSPAPAAPARRPGETPTPFGQLRPGTPTPAARAARPWTWREWGAVAALAALTAAAAVALALRPPATGAQAPTAAPTAAAATAAPTPPPTLARAVVAYDAPGGQAVGALEPGRPYAVAEERGGWRQLDAAGSGLVWVRAWEMDGLPPPTPTPAPTPVPTAAPVVRPPPPVAAPAGPVVTCVPVVDGDNGGALLGQACGATSAERQRRALELLEAATPFTP